MAQIWPVEIDINLFFQSLGTWLIAPMQTITAIGK